MLFVLFHAEHQPQGDGPSFQGREIRQHIEAHSNVTGVIAQNVEGKAQVGGENARFVNGKF